MRCQVGIRDGDLSSYEGKVPRSRFGRNRSPRGTLVPSLETRPTSGDHEEVLRLPRTSNPQNEKNKDPRGATNNLISVR